jgi:hypothetical protein
LGGFVVERRKENGAFDPLIAGIAQMAGDDRSRVASAA